MMDIEDLDSFLKIFSAKLKAEGNYRPEEGECPEFAIALARFIGIEDPVYYVGIRTMTPFEWDSDLESYVEDQYMQETCLSHVILEIDGTEYDWTGADATERWELAFEDSDTEKHSFEWYQADYSKLEHYINMQRRVVFQNEVSTLDKSKIDYWADMLNTHALEMNRFDSGISHQFN